VPFWNHRVNLDKRVRHDHPLRRINAVLDLSFVGQAVAHHRTEPDRAVERRSARHLALRWKPAYDDAWLTIRRVLITSSE